MKNLLIWAVLFFALNAAQAQKIEIKGGKFTFENTEYTVQDDSEKNSYRFISAYHKRNGEIETVLMIADYHYTVFTLYAYKEKRWYDFDEVKAQKYLKESKTWKK